MLGIWAMALTALLITAVMSDMYNYKISNGIIIAGIVSGAVLRTLCGEEISGTILGILLPVMILFILHIFSMIGAADIKLLAAVGAFMGSEKILQVIIFAFLTGGISSFVLMIKHGILKERFRYLANYSMNLIKNRIIVPYESMNGEDKPYLLHFSIFIGIGVGIVLIMGGLL